SPLTVVCGFLETLLDCDGTIAPEDRARYLRMALEHSERMRHLIDDLLILSALETTGQQDETVPLAPLLDSVLEEARALSDGQHTLSLHSDAPEGAALTGSARELRSAFSNLASNAVRYTPAGGQVTLRWRRLDEGEGCFSVEDTGIGIEAAHIPRLTERFFRVDSSRSRETGGTGLGLAIVKHILSRHQARLEVESEPGRGSRFAVILPEFRCRARTDDAPQEDVAQDDEDD
ncbi:MAG: PAS domain-containing sensor histidine kinase, partial [Rhodocyclaceae bacterium]|nr:PAS domain-containing sensor histidine kinase [Rhodocyclaceae bacterium]